MKIYLTGGTGFIGSYVVKNLSDAGHEIVVLARNPGKVPGLKTLPGVVVEEASFQDYSRLDNVITGPDALVHIALGWGDTGPEMMEKETLPSVRLIDLAVKKGARKILFTSSTAASGYKFPFINEESPLRPSDFYGATKGAVELFLRAYAEYFPDRQFNIIRPGYTFGNPVIPGATSQPDRRFHDICSLAKANRDIELIKNDGTQFIWAGDLAKIYRSVLDSEMTGQVFFGLGCRWISWKAITEEALRMTGSRSRIIEIDKGYGDNPVLFSLDKIKKHFGLEFDSSEQITRHLEYILQK